MWTPIIINEKETNYSVSTYGEVRNNKFNRLLRPCANKSGYMTVGLTLEKGKGSKTYYVHRLVAEAFIDNPNNLEQVDHINSDKSDNDVSNLQWVTHQENVEKAKSEVYTFCNPEGEVITVFNLRRFCLENDLNQSAMSNVVNGSKYCVSHKGYTRVGADKSRSEKYAPKIRAFVSPDGENIVVRDLVAFCKENGLSIQGMRGVWLGVQVKHKKWTKGVL